MTKANHSGVFGDGTRHTEPTPTLDGFDKCQWCGGKGQIITPHPIWGDEVMQCPDCEGSGKKAEDAQP